MKILVCYNESELSERVLNKAIEIFEHLNPHFILATVADMDRGVDVQDVLSTDEVEHELRDMVFETSMRLADEGRKVDVIFAVGKLKEMLHEIIKNKVPDYVVVGKRHLTRFGEIEERFLGSVSEYLVQRTVIPILICH